MKDLTIEVLDTDLAYAAGVIDSDGCIHVNQRRTTAGGYTYIVAVTVSLKFDLVPLWFASMFGGPVYRREQSRPGYPPMWNWRLDCRKAANFLETILPYLKIKHVRAEAAIRLARSARIRGSNWKGRTRITEAEYKERARLALIIRNENKNTNARVLSDIVFPAVN